MNVKVFICLNIILIYLSGVESTMITKVLRAIIMGPPGSGKGTISARIIKDFNMKHLSSGDLLRAQVIHKTSAGITAKQFIDKGQLVPDDVMVKLILNELNKLKEDSWMLDGFPRTVPQAKALYKDKPVDLVLNLNVPFEVIIDRIKGRWTHAPSGRIYHTEFNPPKVMGKDDVTGETLIQRDDDKEETVRNRLQIYQNQTQPVLEFYRKHGILTEFTGKYSNEIWPMVFEFLSTRSEPIQYTQYS
ncbi:GTP:AMP phosphotransferase AK3, mitochondrial-like isoform X1 [Pecten maximus]|uniref:GTP:AMP phosphotransferase AK3, mitochondrial-like isoform X1 n=2 Tax=Pecten maximus TaxID=6579 RepID=UPI00145857E0|nr:GTP:AMP phosphotransferase AK3, mitochondrial-like isoform X1 [Pecten maximus]